MPRGKHPNTLRALEQHRPNGRPKLSDGERRVRVDVRLPGALLKRLDAHTDNRSATIEAALERYLPAPD